MSIFNNELVNKGFFKAESFFNDAELADIEENFEITFKENMINDNTAKLDYVKIFTNKKINRIYEKINKFLEKNIDYDFYLRNIWFIKTQNQNYKPDLPFIPHIDKKRYLKVFIYINDITKDNGAFTVSTNSDLKKNEETRVKWWKENNLNPSKNKHGLLIKDNNLNFEPIEMKKGSIVCFDTNTPHFAGYVKPGNIRKVIRFNLFIDQNTSKIKFLIKKLTLEVSRKLNYLRSAL